MKTQQHNNSDINKHKIHNNAFNTKTQRSKAMKPNNIFRTSLTMLIGLVMIASLSFGQGVLKNGGTFTNTGVATYKSVENYKTTAGTIRNSGTLNVSGTGTNDLINTDGATLHGTILNFIGGTGAGVIVVSDAINNNNASSRIDNDSLGAKGTIFVGGNITNAGTFDTDSGKIVYNGTGAQSVISTTYGVLIADQSSTKTLGGAVTVRDSMLIDNNAVFATASTTLTLQGAANVAQNGGSLTAVGSTVTYNGDLTQSIIPAQYFNLALTGATSGRVKTSPGGVSFLASGSLNLATAGDSLEVSSGALDLTNLTNGTYTNNASIRISSTTTPVLASITGSLGNFVYNSASPQTIATGTYNNLTLRAAGTKTFSATDSVEGSYIVESTSGTRDYTGNTFTFSGGAQTIALENEVFNTLRFAGSGAKSVSATDSTTANTVALLGTAQVTNANHFRIVSGGLAIASGTSWTNNASMGITSGGLTNDATFAQSTGALNVTGTILNNAAGVFNVGAAGSVVSNGDFENDGTVTNAGTITVE